MTIPTATVITLVIFDDSNAVGLSSGLMATQIAIVLYGIQRTALRYELNVQRETTRIISPLIIAAVFFVALAIGFSTVELLGLRGIVADTLRLR